MQTMAKALDWLGGDKYMGQIQDILSGLWKLILELQPIENS